MARLRGEGAGPGSGVDFGGTSNIRQVLADLKQIDPRLTTATRRKLRQSGDEAIAEMRSVLAQPSQGVVTRTTTSLARRSDGSGPRRLRVTSFATAAASRTRSRGARAAIAAGLRTRVVAGESRQKVRITGPGDAFARSYNMPLWRHPIRFNPATTSKNDVPWVTQAGRPYFGTVVGRRWREIRKNIEDALTEALDIIAR